NGGGQGIRRHAKQVVHLIVNRAVARLGQVAALFGQFPDGMGQGADPGLDEPALGGFGNIAVQQEMSRAWLIALAKVDDSIAVAVFAGTWFMATAAGGGDRVTYQDGAVVGF